MIDLHLHLDGSLPPALVFALAKEQGIPLPPDAQDAESLTPSLVCPPGCTSLNDYLTRFALPVAVMQTESAIMRCVQGVLAELKSEGVLYAELRFAPGQHCQQGLSQENVVAAACRALADGCRTLGIQAQLILCCMRGAPEAQNAETLRLAWEYLGKGVCAADLAGAEALFPTRSYAPLFAAVPGLPFTIHAGEADGPESIRAALAMGAKRIGHGVRCIEDAALVAELAQKGIPLEVCPTSNLQTCTFADWAHHPLKTLLKAGVKVTVNSDNRTVSGTTAQKEMALAAQHLGLSAAQQARLWLNAADAAFLPEAQKQALRATVQARLAG